MPELENIVTAAELPQHFARLPSDADEQVEQLPSMLVLRPPDPVCLPACEYLTSKR
jgi:hypothetical protein